MAEMRPTSLLSRLGVFRTLKSKIILLTIGAVLVSTLALTAVLTSRIAEVTRETAIERLAGETRLTALQFKDAYDRMKADVQVLAGTPPTRGIARALAGKGTDPLDGSTTDAWRQRLATIFRSIMKTRPDYFQVRYIGADGMEIVRVNRTSDGLDVVRVEDLQDKSAEPYVSAGLNLEKGQIYFSQVSYNRERGVVELSFTPTVRTVAPVFDDAGTMLGIVVINTNYAILLREEFAKIAPPYDTFVVNAVGDFMLRGADGRIGWLRRASDFGDKPAFIRNIVASERDEDVFTIGNDTAYFARINVDPDNAHAALGVILRLPNEILLAPVNQARAIALASGATVIALSLFMSLLFARRFMTPLNQMTAEIRGVEGQEVPRNLPVQRSDEIGELARAFERRARALADSEARAGAIIDNVFDGVLTVDDKARIVSLNPSCALMFGYASDELSGQPVSIVLPRLFSAASRPAEKGKTSSENLWRQFERRLGKTIELDSRRRDGSLFPVQLSVSRVDLDDRTLYTCIIRDVSEQKKTLAALAQAEERGSTALRGARIGVYDVDLTTGTSVVSDTWREMLGFDPDEDIVPQKEWRKRLHPDDRQKVREADKSCIRGHTERSEVEYRIRHKDGHWIWLRSDSRVVQRTSKGKALRLVGTQTDITEVKLAEAALKASEEQFRSAIENAPIAMALLDLEGRWLTVNDAVCRLLGYTEDELRQLSFQDLTYPEDLDEDLSLVGKLLTGHIDSYQLEKRYLHKSGETIWGLLSVSLARDEYGQPAYFISQILDVTNRREVERLQSEFISTVNHELRTPLTAIQGALSLLLARCEERADPKEKMLLANSLESTQRLTRLVTDILDVQKMAQGMMSYQLETLDLRQLLVEIAEMQAPFAEKWGISLETDLPDAQILAHVDPDRFTQAVVNLISNAIKFSGDADRVVIHARHRDDGGAWVAVQDFGQGVPAEFQDKIFGRFAQADGSSTRKVQGSGLGLNITKSIIEAFGGSIGFETEEAKGTTFYFVLPAVMPEARRA